MSAPEGLMEGIVSGGSPRWHDGRLWFCDWGAHQVIAPHAGGGHEVMAAVASAACKLANQAAPHIGRILRDGPDQLSR